MRRRKQLTCAPRLLRHAPELHVIGDFERDLVAVAQQAERQQVIGLGGAVRDLDVIGRRAGIDRREILAQRDGAVRLAIAERHVEDGVEVEAHLGEFAQRHRPDAALAHIHLDHVLPRGLHPLHFKLRDLQITLLS